ncbi:hypothetical protein GE09DRAFT_260553 [Coniochaeta sp. 2T2.1]|nr:hypothetical protein GE09DRAFT_260553 [Coniochaeta sp. 2T2.1]
MDVSQLDLQMHETLLTIHTTLASLDTKPHDARLDELERQRDTTVSTLRTTFEQEADAVTQKRKAELDDITERRRREDEERERIRRLEDEELAEKVRKEDEERQLRLENETRVVEEETNGLMSEVEEEAIRLLEDGKEKLRVLEERRKEINRLIDEMINAPLPSAPSRRRTSRAVGRGLLPVVAAESKTPIANIVDEQTGNPDIKALNEDNQPIAHELDNTHSVSGAPEMHQPSASQHGSSSNDESQSRDEDDTSHISPEVVAQSPIDDGFAGEQHATGDVAEEVAVEDTLGSKPRSVLDSSGLTIKKLVNGNPTTESSRPLGSPKSAIAQPESDRNEEEPPESSTVQESQISKDRNSTWDAEPAPESTSSSTVLLVEQGSVETDARAAAESATSPYADDHFTMTGHEAIPGTMTHGSDDSGSEVIEPIPGTMTHGADYLSAGIENPVEAGTALVEKEDLETVNEFTVTGRPRDTAAFKEEDELKNDGANSPADSAVSSSHPSSHHETRHVPEMEEITVESPGLANEVRTSLDTQAGQNGSKLEQLELDAVLEHGIALDQKSPHSPLVPTTIPGIPAADELPVLRCMAPATSPITSSEGRNEVQPDEDSEFDFSGGDKWSDQDSYAANSSQNDSTEADLSVNTSIDSVEPPDTKTDVNESHATYDITMSPNGPDTTAKADERDSPPNIVERDEPNPNSEGEHVAEVDSSTSQRQSGSVYTTFPERDDGSHQETPTYLFRDDGDPTDHNTYGEQGDRALHVVYGTVQLPRSMTQMDSGNVAWDLASGRSTPETGSQSFVTPLATADFHTPTQFHDWRVNERYEFDQSDQGDDNYKPNDQHATTVHGHGTLFGKDKDDHSQEPSPESGFKPSSDEEDGDQHRNATPVQEPIADGRLSGDASEPETLVLGPSGENDKEPSHEGGSWIGLGVRKEDIQTASVFPTQADPAIPENMAPSTQPNTSPAPIKGMAYSRHNPDRPRTPEQQTGQTSQTATTFFEAATPVDVTNIPWNAYRDSTPRSIHSQSTLSSSPSSPIHSSLPVDNHEPVIRDSWPTPTHDHLLPSGMGRPCNESQLSTSGDFEPFRHHSKLLTAYWQQGETPPQYGQSPIGREARRCDSAASTSSPGGLFQKMRSVFEPAAANRSLPSSGRTSPVWTRAVGGAAHGGSSRVSGDSFSLVKHTAGVITRDGDGYDSASGRRRGGFLAEDAGEDEDDERSSLLQSSYAEELEPN